MADREAAGPADHPLRRPLNDEVHARPYEALKAPERISYLGLLRDGDSTADEHAALAALCERFGAEVPPADANHYSADLGAFRIRWERHTEFTRYAFLVDGGSERPFEETALQCVPADWLATLPGRRIVATHVALLPGGTTIDDVPQLAADHFTGHTLVGAEIAGGAARAYTDFRIHDDGFSRILVRDTSLGSRQAGRMLQRLLEIDTYRMMALLGLPAARRLTPELQDADRQLAAITAAMNAAGEDDPALLQRIVALAARMEEARAATHYRFGASAAYFELVSQRIEELRERRIEGLQTFREFMDRRLMPAMKTCRATDRQLEQLTARIGQAGVLLGTRVDIVRERQNQDLLASMDRRARQQLHLQQTVEGLSVVAITYYAVGLVGYVTKALPVAADPALLQGLSVPLVALGVAFGVRRIRHRIRDDQPRDVRE